MKTVELKRARHVAGAAKRSLASIRTAMTPKLEQTMQAAGEARERAMKVAVSRPLLSLAVAFAIGLSLGIALGTSRERN